MRRFSWTPYWFIAPYMAIFLLFWGWPIIQSFLLSFQNTRVNPWTYQLGVNWGRILDDPAFWDATWNTFLILAIQVPIMLALATFLAVALNSRHLKAKGLFRFAFFAPVVVGEVAYSAIFRLVFNNDFGAVNRFLGNFGVEPIQWLIDPDWAMVMLMIVVTWRWMGYNAIILLAGLQSIPGDLYEAARIDGVSPWRQFTRITVPLLRPVLLFTFVLSIIGTLQIFTEPFLITGGGATRPTVSTLGVYIYQQGFRSFNFGYAASIAYTVAVTAAILSLLQMRLFGKESAA